MAPNTDNRFNFPIYTVEEYLASDFWKKKLSYYFDFIDVDGSGTLTHEDRDLWKKRMLELMDTPLNEEEMASFTSAVNESWAIRGLEEGGPPVTKKDMIRACAERAVVPGFLEHLNTISHRWHRLLDEDNDGVVSWREFEKMHKALGRADFIDDAKMCFEAIDTNGDGVLSKEEWADMGRGFFLGLDPSSPTRFMWNNFDKAESTTDVPEF